MGIFLITLGVIVWILTLATDGSTFMITIAILNIVLGIIGLWGENNEKKKLEETRTKVDESRVGINIYLKKDNFSISKALDVELKMLGRVLSKPFKLKMDLTGDVLTIVGDESNPPELYKEIGISEVPYYRIPINKIRYYVQGGEIISKTKGSGGGSTYSIINGWNGKIKPINISTEIEDTKHTSLYFENENGKEILLTFNYDDFHKFKKLIPRKDYEIVQKSYNNPEVEVKQVNTDVIKIKLQELKELRNQDLITDSEYESTRAKLLDTF